MLADRGAHDNCQGQVMTYLLSGLGTLLCQTRDSGALVHRPLTAALDDVDLLDIGDLTDTLLVGQHNFLRDDAESLHCTLATGPLAGWTAIRSPEDRRSLILTRDGTRLRTSPHADAILLAQQDRWPESRFLPLSPADLAVLRGLLAASWVLGTTAPGLGPQPASIEPGFRVRIGPLDIDLRWNLPFETAEWPHRLTVSRDVWKIERLFRYRPLVYFAVYGDALVKRQFALAVTSLVTVGAYDGDIVVLTDKTPAEIAALFPDAMPARLALLPTPAVDRVAYTASRYAIATWHAAWDFQPLLYADADLLFDRPVAPMLRAIAQADGICVTPEPWPLADTNATGGHLLADDGCHPPPDRMGFNAGTQGIPNMQTHAGTMSLIARTLRNRRAAVGRQAETFVDQPIANYVAYRTGTFDTDVLARFVRLVDATADPADRIGIAHFCWVIGAQARVDVMESYLERVRAMG